MTIHYSIAIDRDHNGDFGGADEEISGRVIALRWRLGMRRAYDSLAEPSWARITVLNADGAFSPERNRLQSGTSVRIQSAEGGVNRTHFTGAISHIEPDEGDFGRKQALIHLQDIQPWLADSPARLKPQINVTADAVIAQLLDGAILRRPVLAGFCLIDVAGYNRINRARIFPPANGLRRLQPGKSRFAYVGDWWRESTSTRQAIGEVAASERGRFYLDREGRAVYLNRHHTLIQRTISARFDDSMSGMDYSFGEGRLNQIAMLMTPREIGASGTLLWSLRSAQRIAQRSEVEMNLRLVDGRNQPVGLLKFERLLTRFQLGPETGGGAIDAGVAAEVVQLGTTSVRLRVVNQSRREVFLTALQLFGKPLYRGDTLEVSVADGEGMHVYGLKRLALDLPALSDIETAQAFATYELARRKHPRGTIQTLRLKAREHLPAALSATLFQRVRIRESQTGHGERDYFIVGEEHHVHEGGTRHEVTWTLEPADSTRFVIVNDSDIDSQDELIAPY